ncbi:hypothetical protein FF38_04687 [Lucilia cuprina]|uniref:Chitin-binding type-2 domain-containing protein n=1 Tax=Lucilia cuprina TaxID=7375 RepID=A0A0L0CLI6_LUCCU|nr:hypothetical protein CVS40_3739 [Lucilia cuprina]KNC33111.1 hypothetical protein FF38_04687 [Lucilia cuprina]
MNARVLLFQILSIFLIYVEHLKAQCNVCSAVNQMACVSQTEYQFCVNNTPSGAVNTCPTDYVCSTATATICLPNSAGVTATCSDCNKCDLSLVFACTGVTTYALCLGQTTPSTDTGTCGAGQVCNINTAQICTTPSAGLTATCPTGGSTITTSTTTTTAATPTFTTPPTVPTYAQYFCQVMRINKRFQVPSEFDTSCRRYIYCFKTTTGTWSGQIYTCAGSTYFDPVSLYCVASRPSSC